MPARVKNRICACFGCFRGCLTKTSRPLGSGTTDITKKGAKNCSPKGWAITGGTYLAKQGGRTAKKIKRDFVGENSNHTERNGFAFLTESCMKRKKRDCSGWQEKKHQHKRDGKRECHPERRSPKKEARHGSKAKRNKEE